MSSKTPFVGLQLMICYREKANYEISHLYCLLKVVGSHLYPKHLTAHSKSILDPSCTRERDMQRIRELLPTHFQAITPILNHAPAPPPGTTGVNCLTSESFYGRTL